MGRTYLYGLMAGGERGVQQAANILREVVAGTVALLGVARIANLRVNRYGSALPWVVSGRRHHRVPPDS